MKQREEPEHNDNGQWVSLSPSGDGGPGSMVGTEGRRDGRGQGQSR